MPTKLSMDELFRLLPQANASIIFCFKTFFSCSWIVTDFQSWNCLVFGVGCCCVELVTISKPNVDVRHCFQCNHFFLNINKLIFFHSSHNHCCKHRLFVCLSRRTLSAHVKKWCLASGVNGCNPFTLQEMMLIILIVKNRINWQKAFCLAFPRSS